MDNIEKNLQGFDDEYEYVCEMNSEIRNTLRYEFNTSNITQGETNFFSFYNEFFAADLGSEYLFDINNIDENNPIVVKTILEHSKDRIPILCDHLIEAGNIIPILFMAMKTYCCSNQHRIGDYYGNFIKLLKDKSKKEINNKNIGEICEEFMEWYISEENSRCPISGNIAESKKYQRYDISENYLVVEFICLKILGMDETVLDFNSRYNSVKKENLDKIIKLQIVNMFGDNPIAVAGWLMPVCFWLNNTGFAYVSKEYIIPAILNTNFCDDFIIKRRIVKQWLINLSSRFFLEYEIFSPQYLQTLLSRPDTECLFDANYHTARNLSFPEMYHLPCSGFGTALSLFLDGKEEIDSDDDEYSKYDYHKKLLEYLKYKSKTEYETLLMLNVVYLFADNKIEAGIKRLTKNYSNMLDTNITLYFRIALFRAFFTKEANDFCVKTELYNIIKYEIVQRNALFGGLFDPEHDWGYSDRLVKEIHSEMTLYLLKTSKSLIEEINKISKDVDPNIKDDAALLRLNKLTNELSDTAAWFSIKSSLHYNTMIEKSINSFYKSVNENDLNKDIYSVLGPKSADIVKSYLRQSELIMDLQTELRNMEWQEELDYSASILYMTKALEYIGNLIFKEITKDTIPPSNIFSMYKKSNNWSDHITLGNIAFLFKNREFLSGDNDIHKLINKSKIKKLKGKVAYCYKNNNGKLKKVKFTYDVNNSLNNGNGSNYDNNINIDKTLNTLFEALNYIADNFRNQAAHCNLTPEEKYTKCKKLMITSEHLLFVLLYIIEDGTILGD
ncbi:MAG: hypothetical protein IJO20_04885 [Ruminococcus sp.]|nr:hypothetical protein [Ruminococcus sp.]